MSKIIQDISVLRQKSTPVSSVEEAKSIIEQLKASFPSNGIGLAAIQIGIPKQVAYLKYNEWVSNAPDKTLILINPELLETIDEFIYLNESCLSFPNIFRDTKRYKQIIIKNNVIDGNSFREERLSFYYSPDKSEDSNDGLMTIAIQHEFDHFQGKLITDYDIKLKPITGNKKIGRNDPCPCGKTDLSGKFIKYKKCCGK